MNYIYLLFSSSLSSKLVDIFNKSLELVKNEFILFCKLKKYGVYKYIKNWVYYTL